jgi:hypothetical protein
MKRSTGGATTSRPRRILTNRSAHARANEQADDGETPAASEVTPGAVDEQLLDLLIGHHGCGLLGGRNRANNPPSAVWTGAVQASGIPDTDT